MRLRQLLEALPEVEIPAGAEEMEITGITDDSREARPGALFVAIRGVHTDGHRHIPDALKRGAVAVIAEERMDLKKVANLQVSDAVDALAKVSACFFGHPSRELTTVGITGTNGKTTASLLVQGILEESGKVPGLIGTLRYEVGKEIHPALNTTPNALHLQSLMRRMLEQGCRTCVMEVSSHALSLGRVRECLFDTRVFTNLTRDHLDFHSSMEDYYEAKKLFFNEEYGKPGGRAVINTDDLWGGRLIQESSGPAWTFGIENQADFRAMDIKTSIHGLVFKMQTPRGELQVESSLIGLYNIYNILCAVAVGVALGISTPDILKGISRVTEIPGRFEKIQGPGFTVVVDYAHTDDALKMLLENARQLCGNNLITIFGCGGDRDRGKRPIMGKIAADLSDRVIVTSDNPRTEDPERIIDDILAGIKDAGPAQVDVLSDRREAIRAGIQHAREGDMVVVAGKGHEDYQILGEKKIHFDDREEVRKALQNKDQVTG